MVIIKPKVLIACTTYNKNEKYLKAYLKGIESQTYKRHELVFCDNSKDDKFAKRLEGLGYTVLRSKPNDIIHWAVRDAMNVLRDYFVKHHYDSMWVLEADQVPPPDALEKLVKADKPVIGVPYILNKNNDIICCHDPVHHQILTYGELLIMSKKVKDGIIRVWGVGHGCVLAKRWVIEKFSFRVDDEDGKIPGASPDTWWYVDLWRAKTLVFCLASMMTDHLRIQEQGEIGKDAIEIGKLIFVRCKNDYWNSATWDNVSMMKGQVKKLPRFVSPITYDAIHNQGLLIEVNVVKELEGKEEEERKRKENKVTYKQKHNKEGE